MEAENKSGNSPHRIAFLAYLELDHGDAYRGGILVTDEWGKPLEFRCTAPVRPSAVQRTLYGQTLLPHIAVELVGNSLLRSVQEKPELIFIQDDPFFDLRYHTALPLLRIRRQGTDGAKGNNGDKKNSQSVTIDSASGKFQPISLDAHWQFPNDSVICGDKLREWFNRWDLSEPFERLKKSLEYVHQQKLLES